MRLERDDASRRHHTALTEVAAEHGPLLARRLDHVGRPAEQRAHRRAEPLREARHDRVGRARRGRPATSPARRRRSRAGRRRGAPEHRPRAPAATAHAVASAAERAPARRACACSRSTIAETGGRWCARSASACATSSGDTASVVVGQAAELDAGVRAPRPRARSGTRDSAPGTAPRCPGAVSTRSAIWFAIVPDAVKSAAAVPRHAPRRAPRAGAASGPRGTRRRRPPRRPSRRASRASAS